MTNDDARALGVELLKMSEAFNAPVSETRAAVYFEALQDLPIETVVAACQRARQTLDFFPSPGKLRTMVGGTSADQAEVAWAMFLAGVREIGSYQSVDFDDEALHETVRIMWGGWGAVAESFTMGEEPYRHAEFLKTYHALAGRNLGPARAMPGLCAMHNRAIGLGEPPPMRVLPPLPAQIGAAPHPVPPKELTP